MLVLDAGPVDMGGKGDAITPPNNVMEIEVKPFPSEDLLSQCAPPIFQNFRRHWDATDVVVYTCALSKLQMLI